MYIAAAGIGSPIFLEDNETAMKSNNKNDNNLWTTDSNGKIDSTIYQGYAGDCAMLTTILGIAGTGDGAKAIADSIKVNKKNGKIESYTVTFKGTGESYKITKAKLDGVNKQWNDGNTGRYSYGDNDMTIIELAIEQALLNSKDTELRYLTDNFTDDNKNDALNGVNPASVAYLLMGEDSEWYTKTKKENSVSAHFNANQDYTTTDTNGKQVKFKDNNYYSIGLSKDGKTVNVYDPKTGKTITVNSKNFLNDVSKKDRNDDIESTKQAFADFEENSDSMALIFTVNNESDTNKNVVKDAKGKNVQLSKEAHAYNVKEVKDGVVTLVNPHDTSKEIKVTLESLLSLTSFDCYSVDLTKAEETKTENKKSWWDKIRDAGFNTTENNNFGLELVA